MSNAPPNFVRLSRPAQPVVTLHAEPTEHGAKPAATGNFVRLNRLAQPNVTLRARDEIASLPRWARVAFAARCARRVFPLFQRTWQATESDRTEALNRAISVVEQAAAAVSPAPTPAPTAAEIVEWARETFDFWSPAAARRVDAAAVAAEAAKAAAEANVWAAAAAAAAACAAIAEDKTKAAAKVAARDAIRGDIETLRRLATGERWTDETPVKPSVFGSMWPKGLPPGWPVKTPQHSAEFVT